MFDMKKVFQLVLADACVQFSTKSYNYVHIMLKNRFFPNFYKKKAAPTSHPGNVRSLSTASQEQSASRSCNSVGLISLSFGLNTSHPRRVVVLVTDRERAIRDRVSPARRALAESDTYAYNGGGARRHRDDDAE